MKDIDAEAQLQHGIVVRLVDGAALLFLKEEPRQEPRVRWPIGLVILHLGSDVLGHYHFDLVWSRGVAANDCSGYGRVASRRFVLGYKYPLHSEEPKGTPRLPPQHRKGSGH